jgi:hypothetical protein
MRKTVQFAVAALLLAATPMLANADGRLSPAALPGFVLGYEASDTAMDFAEWVPKGETVQAWTRMVTMIRLNSLRVTPRQFNQIMKDQLIKSCPGASVSAEASTEIEGRPAASFRSDCPRNPATGKPEVLFHLAISGQNDLHVRQVAFRYLPSAEDVRWANGIIGSTRWCALGSKAKGC